MDRDPGPSTDAGRIPADLFADRVEGRQARTQLIDVGAFLGVAAPNIGVEGGVALALRPVAADQQRDGVRARADRLLRQVAGGVEPALEVRVPTTNERDDDLERLLEPGEDPVLGEAEGVRLARPFVPRAQPEDVAAAADLVERLGCLGDDARIAMERGEHPGPDLDRRGRGGHCAGHRDAIPHATRCLAVHPPQ